MTCVCCHTQILEAEESKEQRLQGELTKAQTDLDSYKAKVLELNGRYEAASKVYDQERTVRLNLHVREALSCCVSACRRRTSAT